MMMTLFFFRMGAARTDGGHPVTGPILAKTPPTLHYGLRMEGNRRLAT